MASPPKGESESAGAKPCFERTSGKAVLDKPHSAGKATGRPLPSRNAPERRQLSRTHSLPASLRPAASRRRGCSRPERRSEKWSAIFGKADSKTKRCSIGLNTIFSPMLSCRAGGIASGISGRRQRSHAKGLPARAHHVTSMRPGCQRPDLRALQRGSVAARRQRRTPTLLTPPLRFPGRGAVTAPTPPGRATRRTPGRAMHPLG